MGPPYIFCQYGVNMTSLRLDFDNTSTLSLESQLERLSLEADVLANVIDSFKNVIPNLTAKISEVYGVLTATDNSSEALKELKTKQLSLKTKIKYVNYLNINSTLVVVPEGFHGDMLSYINLLNKLAPKIFVDANNVLGEYNFILSAFVTNKDNKISLKDHTALFTKVAKERESMNKEISHFFKPNSNISRVRMKDILHRLTDVDTIVDNISKLENDRNKHNVKDVAASVKRAVEMLDIVIKDVDSKGVSNISGNAAMNISQGAYEIGKLVEFIAAFRFRTEQAVASVSDLLSTIEKTA
jgi:hypothetical protein